eukprot:3093694-Prymnesium_polylepis.1
MGLPGPGGGIGELQKLLRELLSPACLVRMQADIAPLADAAPDGGASAPALLRLKVALLACAHQLLALQVQSLLQLLAAAAVA